LSSLADDLFAEMGIPVLEDFLGDRTGVYLKARGGEPTGPFAATIQNATTEKTEGEAGRGWQHVRIASFPVQDGLPFWSGQHLIGLVVTIAGVEWNFDCVQRLSDSMATVRLVRRTTAEISRPGLRRK
jgi:hypothetical protein